MRRKLKNLKNKAGHPRQLIDESAYREKRFHTQTGRHFDSENGGWSWATRPRDQAISLRSIDTGATGATGSTGST